MDQETTKKFLAKLNEIKKALEAPRIHKEEGELQVTRTRLRSGKVKEEKEESRKLTVRTFASYPAHLSVSFARTINMGNYNSLKIGITAVVPCYPEEMPEVIDELVVWTDEILSREVERHVHGGDLEEDEDDFPQ